MLDSLAREGAPANVGNALPESTGSLVKGESEAELIQVLQEMMERRDQVNAQNEEREEGQGGSGSSSRVNGAAGSAEEESIFKQSYIPRTLNEVYDPERDVDILTKDGADKLIYATATGMDQLGGKKKTSSAGQNLDVPEQDKGEEDESDEEESEDSDEDSGSDSEGREGKSAQPRGFRHEDRDEKKERKKAVKEEAREKRQHKMKKKDKKKLIKKASPKGR